MAAPPGGPPDSTPPHIVAVEPDSGALLPDWKGDAVVQFDEVIDEMASGATPTPGGPIAGLAAQIVLSPVGGPVKVSWHRSVIRIRPAEGWKLGRVYHLQILPGIRDLRHNVMKQGRLIVFSTGPVLPHASLAGTVLQWAEQRAVAKAVIRAARQPDTAAYVTIADSGGEFLLTDIPPGRYHVVAIQDDNGNRALDRSEAFDSTTLTVDSTARAVFYAFVHDTAGPKLRAADPSDSMTVRLSFSEPLDLSHRVDTARVHLFALPDTALVPLAGVWSGAQYDSLEARARAVADSLHRAADTSAHRARSDSAKAGAPRPPPPAPPLPAAGPPRAARGAGRDTLVHVDTARIHALLRARAVPGDRVILRTARPLGPGRRYLVRVHGIANLSGALADGQALFIVPVPSAKPARADTTRARPHPKAP